MSRAIILVVVIAGVVLAVRHFDQSGRSAAAVCEVWDTDGVALHNSFQHPSRSDGGLSGLAQLAGAPGALGDLMAKMAAVAPSDVEPAFQELADTFHSIGAGEGSGVSDPLSVLISGFAAGASAQAAVQQVNQFLLTNCGTPGGGASAPAASIPAQSSSGTSTTAQPLPPEDVPRVFLPCQATSPAGDAVEALSCRPVRGSQLTVEWYQTAAQATAQISADAQTVGASSTGGCPAGAPAIGTFTSGGRPVGKLLCYVQGGHAVYAWTSLPDRRYNKLVWPTGNLQAAAKWWG